MAAPEITRVTPGGVLAGTASFRLDIYGTGMSANTAFLWNFASTGISGLTFVDSGHMYCTVDASLVAAAGTVLIVLNDPEDGQGTIKTYTSDSTNSLPAVNSVAPLSVTKNTGPWDVKVQGSGFEYGQSVAYYDGNPMTTSWDTSDVVSGTSIIATIPNEPNAGSHSIDVRTPAPGGGNSSGVAWNVVEPGVGGFNNHVSRIIRAF